MKTQEALKIYNNAERIINRYHPGISATERAKKIVRLLNEVIGEDEAELVLDLVFEREFKDINL